MIKKIFALLLMTGFLNSGIMPAIAATVYNVNSEYVSDFDLNNSELNQPVQFRALNEVKTKEGVIIPKGSVYNGKITNLKKSKGFYCRANGHVSITDAVLPSGEKYAVTGDLVPDKLKGSAVANVVKGVVTTPFAIVTGALGTVVMLAEGVTIVGLPLAKSTATATKETMGKMTKGVNCKRSAGKNVSLKIKEIKKSDVSPANPALTSDKTDKTDNADNTQNTQSTQQTDTQKTTQTEK